MRKNTNSRILLLEDEIELSNTICEYLSAKGYEVVQAFNGFEAGEKIFELSFDLFLFDVNVPMQNGFELLREIREKGVGTPVIMITSLDDVDSVERGFNLGCDDYIRKPFALRELFVRIESIIQRSFSHNSSEKIEITNIITYDTATRKLLKNNIELKLKTKEHLLLQYMLQNPNRILSKEEIFSHIYDYEEEPSEGSLRAYIKNIRNYIGKDRIKTIKNIGYIYASS